MKSSPAPRGPDPFTVVHRRVSPDGARLARACGAPFGRSGNWPDALPCPDCAAVPVAPPAPAPTPPVFNPRPRRTIPRDT